MKQQKQQKQQKLPQSRVVAYCDYHGIQMTYGYIRRRGCVIQRFCKHLWWVGTSGADPVKLNPRKPKNHCGMPQFLEAAGK